MAVAECPNCHHDIQTPPFRFWKSGWKNFECLYCRAKLERKKRPKWMEAMIGAIPVLIAMGLPAKVVNHTYLIAILIPLVIASFSLSRPKLSVITAPIDPAEELNTRQLGKQLAHTAAFEHFRKKKDEPVTELRINR
jgi:hypothetical protein